MTQTTTNTVPDPGPVAPSGAAEFRSRVSAAVRGYAVRLAIRHWVAPNVLRAYFAATGHQALRPTERHAEVYTTRLLERALPLLEHAADDAARERLAAALERVAWPVAARAAEPPVEVKLGGKARSLSRIGCAVEPGGETVRFPDADGDGRDRGGRATRDTATPFCPYTNEYHFDPTGPTPRPDEVRVPDVAQTVTCNEFRNAAFRQASGGEVAARVLGELLRAAGRTGNAALLADELRVCEPDPAGGRVAFAPGVLPGLLAHLHAAAAAVAALHDTAGFATDLAREFQRLSRARIDTDFSWSLSYLWAGRKKGGSDPQARAAELLGVTAANMAAQLPYWWGYADYLLRLDPALDFTAAGLDWTEVPALAGADGEPDPDGGRNPAWRLRAQFRQELRLATRDGSVAFPVPTLFFEAFLRSLRVPDAPRVRPDGRPREVQPPEVPDDAPPDEGPADPRPVLRTRARRSTRCPFASAGGWSLPRCWPPTAAP